MLIELQSGGLYFVLDKDKDEHVRLIHFSARAFDKEQYKEEDYSGIHSLLELHMLGADTNDHHASRHTKTSPARELKYVSHRVEEKEEGQHLTVQMSDGSTQVCMHYQFYNYAAVVRSYAVITNLSEEEAVYNMVNAMLGRVHQSGFLNRLPKANLERVKEGIACYKSIRQEIKTALPRFPLGYIGFDAPWACGALDCGTHWYLSVWRGGGENDTIEIPIPSKNGKRMQAECMYPQGLPVQFVCDRESEVLRVTLKEKYRARFFKITWREEERHDCKTVY